VQDKENQGFSYEAADASFDLLVRRHVGAFARSSCSTTTASMAWAPRATRKDLVEATVKLSVRGPAAPVRGRGPRPGGCPQPGADRRPAAVISALTVLHLVDYKVRVVNSADGTAAKVRVLIEHEFQGRTLGTVGVSENIIEASWNALVEAIEYALSDREPSGASGLLGRAKG
jgi:2-isopropylmalate synthase